MTARAKLLFLEERIAIVRKALNEQTMPFGDLLPKDKQLPFKQFVMDCMNVLDGDYFGDARERLKKP